MQVSQSQVCRMKRNQGLPKELAPKQILEALHRQKHHVQYIFPLSATNLRHCEAISGPTTSTGKPDPDEKRVHKSFTWRSFEGPLFLAKVWGSRLTPVAAPVRHCIAPDFRLWQLQTQAVWLHDATGAVHMRSISETGRDETCFETRRGTSGQLSDLSIRYAGEVPRAAPLRRGALFFFTSFQP